MPTSSSNPVLVTASEVPTLEDAQWLADLHAMAEKRAKQKCPVQIHRRHWATLRAEDKRQADALAWIIAAVDRARGVAAHPPTRGPDHG